MRYLLAGAALCDTVSLVNDITSNSLHCFEPILMLDKTYHFSVAI